MINFTYLRDDTPAALLSVTGDEEHVELGFRQLYSATNWETTDRYRT